MEAIHPVALSPDSEEWVVPVKWVGLDEAEAPWELVHHIYLGVVAYLVNQFRKLKLAKVILSVLLKMYRMKIQSRGSGFCFLLPGYILVLGLFIFLPKCFLCFGVFNVFYPGHDALLGFTVQFRVEFCVAFFGRL